MSMSSKELKFGFNMTWRWCTQIFFIDFYFLFFFKVLNFFSFNKDAKCWVGFIYLHSPTTANDTRD